MKVRTAAWALVTLGAFVIALAAFVPERSGWAAELKGDVNCNGTVNAIDATLILQVVAGLIDRLRCPEAADTNADGSVNALDASLVVQYNAGLIDRLGPPPAATQTPEPPTNTPTFAPRPTNTNTPAPRPTNTPTRTPTRTLTPVDAAAIVNQWNTCTDTWWYGSYLEGLINLTRGIGGDTSYTEGEFADVWEYLQSYCLGIGRWLASVPGSERYCSGIRSAGSLISSFLLLSRGLAYVDFSLEFALNEVDEFLEAARC